LKDVVAVNLKTSKVRVLSRDMGEADAEAYVKMAVMRRGVDEEFFSAATAGMYAEGDEWIGQHAVDRAEAESK